MQNIVSAHCNRCGRNTNHDLIGVERQQYETAYDENPAYDLYEMLRCRGCNTIAMRNTCAIFDPDDPIVIYYPPVIARRAPDWVTGSDVPGPICALMRETYTAAQNNSRRLVAMGIRAVLENVMIEKVGDLNGFKTLVDAFQKAGYLSVRQAGALDSTLEAGHATIHRGWEPSNDDISTLLDITEAIIESVYLHEARAQKLDKNVPKRRRPGKPDQ